jgi:hypothetical protein
MFGGINMINNTVDMLERVCKMLIDVSDELTIYENMGYMSLDDIDKYNMLKVKYKTIKEIMGVE